MSLATGVFVNGDIEVDPDILKDLNSDSYDSSGYNTEITSLTSSILHYTFENGRRYQMYYGLDKSYMPNDETKQDRCWKASFGTLDSPQRILDVGTGTGIWTIDCADLYPSAEVIGTDLSPIQPAWVPPNVKFEVDNAEKDWTYTSVYFDFVHSRNLAQSISDWPKFLSQCQQVLKPGGYVELAELSIKAYSDNGTTGAGFQHYCDKLEEACNSFGRPVVAEDILRTRLENAGFVDVVVQSFKQTYGPWASDERLKNIGSMVLLAAETGTEGYGMALFTRVLGMTPEEALAVCRACAKDIKNKNHHSYTPYIVAYGRKPE